MLRITGSHTVRGAADLRVGVADVRDVVLEKVVEVDVVRQLLDQGLHLSPALRRLNPLL